MLNIQTCVDALAQSALNREAAFQTEIGVSLLIFYTEKSSDVAAKTLLRELYDAAGYVCLIAAEKQDYKTVNRRINVSARLYDKLTSEIIGQWSEGGSTDRKIKALAAQLRELGLVSIDSVKAYVTGKTRKEREAKPKTNILQFNRRLADRKLPVGTRHVVTAHIAVDVPPDVPREEIQQLIIELMKLLDGGGQQQQAA